MSSKILDARKSGNFKDWDDLIARVKGVGQGNAVRFSGQGLTVNGASYKVEAAQSAASAARK
jgi:competence protein ComEA